MFYGRLRPEEKPNIHQRHDKAPIRWRFTRLPLLQTALHAPHPFNHLANAALLNYKPVRRIYDTSPFGYCSTRRCSVTGSVFVNRIEIPVPHCAGSGPWKRSSSEETIHYNAETATEMRSGQISSKSNHSSQNVFLKLCATGDHNLREIKSKRGLRRGAVQIEATIKARLRSMKSIYSAYQHQTASFPAVGEWYSSVAVC